MTISGGYRLASARAKCRARFSACFPEQREISTLEPLPILDYSVADWAAQPGDSRGISMLQFQVRRSAPAFALCFCTVLATPNGLFAAPGTVTLFDQNDSDNGYVIDSDNFTDGSFSAYNSFGSDDFVVPSGHKWKIREIDVTGAYNPGPGPATSENVIVYSNYRGRPGKTIAECDSIKGTDNEGAFRIKIPITCRIVLSGGSTSQGKAYWVSIVANINYTFYGAWAWETRNGQNGKAAEWENPSNGFGTGCRTWQALVSCFGNNGEGADFMFALKGDDIIKAGK